MKNEHRVLTPESVEFVYELGGLGSRMLAAVLDHLIVVALLLVVWLAACFGGGALFLGTAVFGLGLIGSFVVYFGYFA